MQSSRPSRLSTFAFALSLVGSMALPIGGHAADTSPSSGAEYPENPAAVAAAAEELAAPAQGELRADTDSDSDSDSPVPPPAPAPTPSTADAVPNPIAPTAAPTAQTFDSAVSDTPAAEPEPGDLWERIRRGFRMPELSGPLVRRSERYYASKPEYVSRMTERASRYLFHIVEEIERRGLPTEIALLPFIESAFNPQALSSAKASGMWQFIPGTGKIYGLKQNMFQDERRDVLESTRAALDYLTKLHGMFGDWQLAFAAYNWGEGAVQRAIERNLRHGKPTDYQSLKMPNETRQYVPKLQAVKNIIANPEQFNLDLPPLENEEYFTTITKTRDIDVERAAAFAGMSVEEFRALNPSFNKPVIVGATMPELVLPKDKAEQFMANLNFAEGPLSSYTAYKMQSAETLESIAPKFGTTSAELRDINGIPAGARPRAGTTILVPKPAGTHGDIPEDVAENAVLVYEPGRSARRAVVKVRRGDTLSLLARRHRVTVTQLAQWNGLPASARLRIGQSVVVERAVRGSRIAKAHRRATHTATRRGGARVSALGAGGRPARISAPR